MYKLIILTFWIFLLESCYKNTLSISELNFLKKELSGKEVNIGRNAQYTYIRLRYDTCVISYKLDRNYNNITATSRCAINSFPKKIEDSLLQEEEKTIYLLQKYNIKGLSEQFSRQGILFELYDKNNGIYLYCPDTGSLEGSWVEYVNESKSLNNGWYYKK